MYAPVRGPKTAVPLTEAIWTAVQAGTTYWKVKGKKGTIVRTSPESTFRTYTASIPWIIYEHKHTPRVYPGLYTDTSIRREYTLGYIRTQA